MKFRHPDGEFDVAAFEHAVDVVFLAQEILVSNSSYPTEKIGKNAHAMRQLGLGYANLGALLMARGLAYDSDEGRAYAAAITALMTGRAYRQSAAIAARMGPFDEFEKNRGPMLGVMENPAGQNGGASSELLILDVWNNLDGGLNTFFSDHNVQEGGSMIFTEREPVVWMPARGAYTYHLAAPKGKNDRFVGVIRGPVHSHEQALAVHNEFASMGVNQARLAGNLSHDAYFRLAQPGTPESLEFLAVDTWMDGAGMAATYTNPAYGSIFSSLFSGPFAASTWQEPAGEWIEW